MTDFDLIFVADPRFEGGSSTALALELAEAARMGLTCGLLFVRGAIIRHPLLSHPDIRRALERGLIHRIDPEQPCRARAVLIHHPGILTHALYPRPRITTGRTVLVLHHPLQDAAGRPQYDLARVVEHGAMGFGTDILLAPVSDVVRRGLPPSLPQRAGLTPDNWNNLIELALWPRRLPRLKDAPVVLGRHARPDPKKWPDTAEEAFASLPTPEGWSARILGGGAFLGAKYGPLPVKWHVEPFRATGIADWLAGLDFWVYFHASSWSEAFGRAIVEAMAVGVPVILHETLRPLFGEAVTYCQPGEVEAVIRDILAKDRWQELSDRGRAFVETKHAAELFRPRIEALLAPIPAPAPRKPPASLPKRTVLFLSSNGIGMGHLTQQIAIANRLPRDLVPVFASMSYAISLAREAGFATEFIPHHRNGGLDPAAWNTHLAELLFELLTRLRPSVVVYDATAAFDGVIRALRQYRAAFTIWMRRPMWQGVHRPFLEALWSFDAVVEPGELAGELDQGPTREQDDWVLPLPPVLHLAPEARLSRADAREILGIAKDELAVSLQLGGGNNFPLEPLRAKLIRQVLARGASVFEFLSPILSGADDPPLEGPKHRQLRVFPQFRLSRAFDAAISMAGYNAFHEHLLGGVPTLFIPNEAPEMDLQVNRAIWAELAGCGLCLRRDHDLPRAEALVERLLDPSEQARMRKMAARLAWKQNGATVLAEFIEDHARLVRADRSHGIVR